MSQLIIETRNLTLNFSNRICALDNLTLQVPKGIIFGFLGANGSGKTTTIQMLLGLLKPTSGSAKVLGHDTQTQGDLIRDRSGVLLEHSGLYERINVRENLEFYGRIYRLPKKARGERIKELLCCMGLWERRHDRVGKLSRGMKQKLAIARALLHRPPLIFLDEPTAGLDPVAAAVLGEMLTEMVAREKVTVFLTTHHLVEAEQLCARVGILKQGKLLASGSPSELKANLASPIEIYGRGFNDRLQQLLRSNSLVTDFEVHSDRLLVNLHPNAEISLLVRLLVQAGCEIEAVKDRSSLEEIFLNLMEES